ncbi:MAG: bifunctional adenosylcobinamide kinase/adenosylcobinamide-phosphate guanylyltransferase [Smithellaceae bacterium]
MGKLIFITGGSRSGKSSLTVKMAQSIHKRKIFIATCIPEDDEMKKRVTLHRKSRPSSWRTIEQRGVLVSTLKKETQSDVVIIIDCLTLFVSSLLMKKTKEDRIKNEVSKAVDIIKGGKSTVIIVSNEVGSGLVPESKLGRDFRDIAGFCNQIVARGAEEVIYMVSGIPLKIKGASQ